MSTLRDRLDRDNARAWRPDDGTDDAFVEGEIVNIDQGTSDYKGIYPIVTLRKDDGEEIAVHAFRTVLLNKFIELQPKIGERIGITYLGEIEAKPGSPYKTYIGYKVELERASGSFDWSRVGAEPEPEPAAPATPDIPADAGEDEIPF
jgi:hypothetical protein